MANYSYDEAGNMAAYFALTFLSILLIPLSLSSITSRKRTSAPAPACQCQHCIQQRENIRKSERGSLLKPQLRKKTIFLLVGWALVAFLVTKVGKGDSENVVYDPFEILGLSSGVTLKEIKSHYKKLSRTFHPDKVKLGINETMDAVEAKFVQITKAYKSLTDETIRKNWETYGHPDGRQEISMGIALPKWVVESGNNIWVLGVYGLIFGGALPALVGRWWFGNRQKTKDGVSSRSAATFFKSLTEESGMDDVVSSLGKTFEWERPEAKADKDESEIGGLETKIKAKLESKWAELSKLAEVLPGEHERRRRAFVLLYAHLLRLPVSSPTLRQEQAQVLLQTPTLLGSLLTISVSRNWLSPTLAAMRLHAYLAQALPPGQEQLRFAQLPGVDVAEASASSADARGLDAFIGALEAQGDARAADARVAARRWGAVQLVGAAFRVIGERVVTPSSIVYLVVKLRLTPFGMSQSTPLEALKEEARGHEAREEEFLVGKKDVEDMPQGEESSGWVHAPFWPANRKPSWWIVLADAKANKVMVPPMRVADVPAADSARGYRLFKMQFQAPPTPGLFRWRIHVVSDTFVGEEVAEDIVLKIEDAAAVSTEDAEDDISEPEEDSLAGQMAMMRGGSVKKHREGESDDESSTDDDDRPGDTDSDSDSD